MTVKILAVDDEFARHAEFRMLSNESNGQLQIEAWPSVSEAATRINEGLTFDAAIIDFHLQTRPQKAAILKDGTPVTTGLGFMAWLRERFGKLPLFALTDIGRPHAALYYAAAFTWFNATPLFEREFFEPTDHVQTIRELLNPTIAFRSSSAYQRVEVAAGHFYDLMHADDAAHSVPLTFDWLRAYAHSGLNRKQVQSYLRSCGYDLPKLSNDVFARKLAAWQTHLQMLLQVMGHDTNLWSPHIPLVNGRPLREFDNLSAWVDNGPVFHFLNTSTGQDFLLAADVRAAMLASHGG